MISPSFALGATFNTASLLIQRGLLVTAVHIKRYIFSSLIDSSNFTFISQRFALPLRGHILLDSHHFDHTICVQLAVIVISVHTVVAYRIKFILLLILLPLLLLLRFNAGCPLGRLAFLHWRSGGRLIEQLAHRIVLFLLLCLLVDWDAFGVGALGKHSLHALVRGDRHVLFRLKGVLLLASLLV